MILNCHQKICSAYQCSCELVSHVLFFSQGSRSNQECVLKTTFVVFGHCMWMRHDSIDIGHLGLPPGPWTAIQQSACAYINVLIEMPGVPLFFIEPLQISNPTLILYPRDMAIN